MGKKKKKEGGRGGEELEMELLPRLFVYLLKLGGGVLKKKKGGGGSLGERPKNMRRSDEVKIDCANTA